MPTLDASAFLADLAAIGRDINSRGVNAFAAVIKEASDSTNEWHYQNRTGRLTATRRFATQRIGKEGWFGEIVWPAPYALWVDKATKPHPIFPVRAKMLRWYSYGQPVFRYSVMHPGTAGAGFSEHARQLFNVRASGQIQSAVDAAIQAH